MSVTVEPPAASSSTDNRLNATKQHTLPIPASDKQNYRRSASYDNLKPLDVSSAALQPQDDGYSLSTNSSSLSVTSRQQKRRSINPGLTLSPFNQGYIPNSSATLSPRSETHNPAQPPAPPGYSEPPRSSSPADQPPKARPISHVHSLHSVRSHSSRLNDANPSTSPSPSTQGHEDQTVVLSPSTSESYPFGLHGYQGDNGRSPSDPPSNLRSQQRSSGTSNFSLDAYQSGSRSASPAYRADVPHSVESGTDTEPESDVKRGALSTLPPALPPKDPTARTPSDQRIEDDSDCESSPVERIRTSTFIAPALPPIRFSLNPAEFSDLLNSVNHNNPRAEVAQAQQKATGLSAATTAPGSGTTYGTPDDGLSQPATPTADSLNGHASSNGLYQANGIQAVKSSQSSVKTQITITPSPTAPSRSPDLVTARLKEALDDAKDRNAQQLKVDRAFLEAILHTLESKNGEAIQMKGKLDGMRVSSLSPSAVT